MASARLLREWQRGIETEAGIGDHFRQRGAGDQRHARETELRLRHTPRRNRAGVCRQPCSQRQRDRSWRATAFTRQHALHCLLFRDAHVAAHAVADGEAHQPLRVTGTIDCKVDEPGNVALERVRRANRRVRDNGHRPRFTHRAHTNRQAPRQSRRQAGFAGIPP